MVLFQIVWNLNESLGNWAGLPPLWFGCHWLAMCHSCLNPIIYWWMNARFRQSFQMVLRFPRRRASRPANPGVTCTSMVTSRKIRNGVATATGKITVTVAAEDVM